MAPAVKRVLFLVASILMLAACSHQDETERRVYFGVGGIGHDQNDREVILLDMPNGDGSFNTGSCELSASTRWLVPQMKLRRAIEPIPLKITKAANGDCIDISEVPRDLR
jgi:hypothetical protein